MGALENEHIYGIQIRESANDGSDFANPDADYRVAFLGEDGLWHVKDSAGSVSDPFSSSGSGDFSAGTLRVPVGTGALTTTEGYVGWQSTTERLRLYDGQREITIGDVGWMPYAFPAFFDPGAALTTALNLPANGGSIAIPYVVTGHMLLDSVSIWSTDTGSARAAEWRLFQQRLNNGNGSENTLDAVTGADGTWSFTPGSASARGSNASSEPVYLAPGVYWLVIRNTHATNTFGLGSTAAGNTGWIAGGTVNIAQTKTLGSALTTTLDFVAATWTKVAASYAARLGGRVFGETAQF
jgi:hypothetical protein